MGRFRSDRERKAMFARMGKGRGSHIRRLNPSGDYDRDGVRNANDCRPFDRNKQDFGLNDKQQKLVEKEVKSKIKNSYDEARGEILVFENGQEWLVFDDEDSAIRAAEERVRDDISEDASLFAPNFIESHFDTKRFINEIHSDVENQAWEAISENPKDHGLTKKDVEEESIKFQEAVETGTEAILKDIEYDPIDYLKGLGMEDRISWYVNEYEAAEDAVAIDGAAHFLATYDGDQIDLEDGTVMFRVN